MAAVLGGAAVEGEVVIGLGKWGPRNTHEAARVVVTRPSQVQLLAASQRERGVDSRL
jgi:hypothetical protein